jgi:hypothetical protein
MAAPAHIAALQALMAHQQGAHTGLPGGLGDAMTDAQRAVLLTHASRFKCENVRVACTVAPDEPDAHETIHKHIQVLMHKLIASKWYLKELEDVAMEWLVMQFQGRAADHWVRVVGAARVTATTSGIGHNSVLYRCLRDMLLAYPATGIKANLLLRKVRDLPWKSKATVEQICITTTAYYEAYQRAVALTQHLDVTLLVPDQDWPTRFTEMQAYFPEWATKLVVDYPGRFNNEQACWTALVAEASRKAAGKAMGAGGGLSQLTGVCTAGDLDDRDAYVLPAGFPASGGIYYEDEEYLVDGGLYAMRRPSGCWRCGSQDHLRKDCSYKASPAELAGAPVNQWAKMPPRPGPPPARPASAVPGTLQLRPVLPSPQTGVAQVADYATKEDIAHILTKINAINLSSAMSGAPLAPLLSAQQGTHRGAVAQMATSAPPLIAGGPQPEGYVYIGSNHHGDVIWGSRDTVVASMMEAGTAGNDEGM